MGDISKDILDKEKLYNRNRKAKYPVIIFIIVLIVYIFLFSSNFIIPKPITDKSLTTLIGHETEYSDNRAYTLVSAQYSKEQKLMEIILNLKNENYDNINDYFYAITSTGANSKDIKINEVINDDLLTVIRFENLKPRYGEVTFMFAPRIVNSVSDVTDEDTATIILNRHNVKSVAHIDTNKTKTDYAKNRLETMVGALENKLELQNRKLKKYENELEALKKEEVALEEDQKYMTDSEIESKKKMIEDNNIRQYEATEKIKNQHIKIEKTKEEIVETRNKIANL